MSTLGFVRRNTRRARADRVAEFYPYTTKRHLDAFKRAAMRAVHLAKANGTLIPQPCEACKARASKSEAHHDDYRQPLEIRWFCRYHHRQRDAELRDERRRTVRAMAEDAAAIAESLVRARSVFPQKSRRSFALNYEAFDLVRAATMAVSGQMDMDGVSESVLSRRLGISRAMVNVQFAGGFRSLKTLAAYSEALGCDVRIDLVRRAQKASA